MNTETIEISQPNQIGEEDQSILDKYMNLTQQAKDGQIGAKDVYADLYVLLKALKELQDEVKDQAIDELERYTKHDVVERNGFEMKVQSRKDYSYKHDPQYVMIDEKRKARQRLMKKAAGMNEELFDPMTGEVIPPAEIKSSTFIKMDRLS